MISQLKLSILPLVTDNLQAVTNSILKIYLIAKQKIGNHTNLRSKLCNTP